MIKSQVPTIDNRSMKKEERDDAAPHRQPEASSSWDDHKKKQSSREVLHVEDTNMQNLQANRRTAYWYLLQ